MSFTVSFTGQRKDEGIVVDSLAQAMTRVNQLQPEQFPAAIWEVPDGEGHGRDGRLVRKYFARRDGEAIDVRRAACTVEVRPGWLQYLPGLLAARHPQTARGALVSRADDS